jgi:type IV secretory pathway ATPase VirB11/archaellum biosynthesis ATPase
MLVEIAQTIQEITREGYLTADNYFGECEQYFPQWQQTVQQIVTEDMRRDPIGAYVKLQREIRHRRESKRDAYHQKQRCIEELIEEVLKPLHERLGETDIVQQVKGQLTGYHVGDRSLYREIFHPLVRPNFMLTKYKSLPPEGGEEIDRYEIKDGVEVYIYRLEDEAMHVYHLSPPESRLSEEKYTILDAARRYMGQHRPESGEFAKPERMRDVFKNIGRDMLLDISDEMDVALSTEELEQMSDILTRYTAGLGVLELLFADKNVQDVYVNSPVGKAPIYLQHSDYEECKTNLVPTLQDAESWATRFRIQSGRPLDEANPVLDTDLEVPGGRARVAVITRNLSPEGLAFAFRRHRDDPWTYPLFVDNNYINSLTAGVLSFLIDGARTMLISGTRSAGKSSLLGASLLELMKKTRIVTVEDTLELPVPALQDMGYNIERMKSRSVITQVESEIPADEAIRTALRLGDSSLIVGEVRSTEAQALYEAMRVGAVANFVGGTIHGENAYSVFDRVVNDLGVPKTSFKATDIITQVNRLRGASGLNMYRRMTGITEVRKEWTDDPQDEGAFVDLMSYDAEDDEMKPTDTLLNGESLIINRIAENTREWKNDWEAVWNNIQLRKRIVERQVELGQEQRWVMEAEFHAAANEKFHIASEKVREEFGELDSDRIYERWNDWATQAAKAGPSELSTSR